MTETDVKKTLKVTDIGPKHWVGDAFHVHSFFSAHREDPSLFSPFLLLDYAAPRKFEPSDKPRGVGEHPHRGFETVTFAYQGSIDHRDSGGGGGRINPGDVQWMTAGSGLVHEEMLSQDFNAKGGTLEMVQLWVNLPKKAKMTKPRYQELMDADFPRVELGAARLRLIAGSLDDQVGPAKTYSPLRVLDGEFTADGTCLIPGAKGDNTLILALKGNLQLPESMEMKAPSVAFLERESDAVKIKGKAGAKFVLLSGEPIDEPVVAHGPFVMNTHGEIKEAMQDYFQGKMGHV